MPGIVTKHWNYCSPKSNINYNSSRTHFLVVIKLKKVTSQNNSPLNTGRLVPKFKKQAMPTPITAANPGAQRSWRNVFDRCSSPSNNSSQVDGIFIVLDVFILMFRSKVTKRWTGLTNKCQQWHFIIDSNQILFGETSLDYFWFVTYLWIWGEDGVESS